MEAARPRYPGAQPFSDDDLARAVFFGRDGEGTGLANQILGNRLVVVYAKSGLGKTSLLNAGVAWRLREADCLPLIVRVNDTKDGALDSVYDGVRAAAERQAVEYQPGDTRSLWSFFETAEFWRGDTLLRPVLIIDQFEELFTLQSMEHRTAFITELGFLLRGVRPPASGEWPSDASDAPPSISVVLSLREDFLGLLEEAADSIPQILDCRFRLTPMSVEAASEALTRPAGVEDPAFRAPTFRYDQRATTAILTFLARQGTGAALGKPPQVEPFHLQLICLRVEDIVITRQTRGVSNVEVALEDLGGPGNFGKILKDFYRHEIGRIPKRRLRRAARRLCGDYLISPEGRRLSLEEAEIQRLLRIPVDALSELVNRKLLRRDLRAENIYYELGHDSLMNAVLSHNRIKHQAEGMGKILASATLFGVATGSVFLICYMVYHYIKLSGLSDAGLSEVKWEITSLVAFLLFLAGGLSWSAKLLFWNGIETMRRYRQRG